MLVNLALLNRMTKQKIFASGFLALGFLFLSFGIAQLIVSDFPAYGRSRTQSFYTTLSYFFGPYAAYVGAAIWIVFGVLLIGSAIQDLRAKPTDAANQERNKKTAALVRLRNRISRKKREQDGV